MKALASFFRPRALGAWGLLFSILFWCGSPQLHAQTGAGTAASFDGVNDFVSIANSPSLNVYPITVMGWMRSFDQGIDKGIVNKYVPGSLNGYQLYFNQGRVRAWYFRDANNYVWDG